VSVILGAVVVVIGLEFRSTVESAQNEIVGGLLIATGIGFAVLGLTGHGHSHPHGQGHADGHDHPHEHEYVDPPGHDDPQGHVGAHGQDDPHGHIDAREHDRAGADGAHEQSASRTPQSRAASLAAVMVPFGAAASPDLTILPVFLAAATVGPGPAVGSLFVFAAVTIGTIVALTLLAAAGGYQIRGQWLERWGNLLTAFVLVVIGSLILAGVL
jgi:nickel/cobalt transporter (NicO) family protein